MADIEHVFPGGDSVKEPACQCKQTLSGEDLIPVLGRSPEGGHSNPLQCSFLENHRDGGAWWVATYGVTQSQTRLNRLSSSRSNSKIIESTC